MKVGGSGTREPQCAVPLCRESVCARAPLVNQIRAWTAAALVRVSWRWKLTFYIIEMMSSGSSLSMWASEPPSVYSTIMMFEIPWKWTCSVSFFCWHSRLQVSYGSILCATLLRNQSFWIYSNRNIHQWKQIPFVLATMQIYVWMI